VSEVADVRRICVLLAVVGLFGAGAGCNGKRPPTCPTSPPSSPSPTCVIPAVEAGSATPGTRTGGGGYNFTLTQPIPQAHGTQIQTADLDISLTVQGDQVSGTVRGPTRQKLTQPSCPSDTLTDGRTEASVTGTLTSEKLTLTVTSARWTEPRVQACPGGGSPGLLGDGFPSGIFDFEKSLSALQHADDGAYRYDHTETIQAHSPFTVEYHIVVRFAA
jgi:hypothetical protein